jgi:hypothetical protein
MIELAGGRVGGWVILKWVIVEDRQLGWGLWQAAVGGVGAVAECEWAFGRCLKSWVFVMWQQWLGFRVRRLDRRYLHLLCT